VEEAVTAAEVHDLAAASAPTPIFTGPPHYHHLKA
jgi:hypothetical protein